MSELDVDPVLAKRLQAFLASDLFVVRAQVAKSDYWKHFSGLLHTAVQGSRANVTGVSGFYIPQPASTMQRAVRRVGRLVKQPTKTAVALRRVVTSRFAIPRLLSYEAAFDATMSHADISMPIVSRFTIDHRKLALVPGVLTTAASIRAHYREWSGYDASANIINHYYYLNLLRGFVGAEPMRTVLEIGAGNGNFPSIIFHECAPVRAVMIDLPETLAVAIPFVSNLFPSARCVMPHEIQDARGLPAEFDFAFLTVDQLDLLDDDSVDLAINCHSFQEMTHEQIDIYLKLVQRVCHSGGFFFAANRVEKIPSGANPFVTEQADRPNRFAEYPWDVRNEVLIYEISRLTRLVQLDAVALRLECIRK
jgi:putative sugar O-methyltransferase